MMKILYKNYLKWVWEAEKLNNKEGEVFQLGRGDGVVLTHHLHQDNCDDDCDDDNDDHGNDDHDENDDDNDALIITSSSTGTEKLLQQKDTCKCLFLENSQTCKFQI